MESRFSRQTKSLCQIRNSLNVYSASRGLGSETLVRQCDGGSLQNVSSSCVSLPHGMESQTIILEREVRYLVSVESIQGLSRREKCGLEKLPMLLTGQHQRLVQNSHFKGEEQKQGTALSLPESIRVPVRAGREGPHLQTC